MRTKELIFWVPFKWVTLNPLTLNPFSQFSVKPFDITGRPMAGWIMAQEPGWKTRVGPMKWLDVEKKRAVADGEEGEVKTKKTMTLREYKA